MKKILAALMLTLSVTVLTVPAADASRPVADRDTSWGCQGC